MPVGSIIIIADGWQYRPERLEWTGSKPTRRDNVSTSVVVIDEAWWGTLTKVAFNVSQTSHTQSSNQAITITPEELAKDVFKVIVPESVAPEKEPVMISSNLCVEESTWLDLDKDGVDEEYKALTKEAMGFMIRAYYFSQNGNSDYITTTDGTSKNYIATKVFAEGDLPEGAVIWVASGWQYRPEGWINDIKNEASARPGNVSTTYVVMDDAWWGLFTERAFNIHCGSDITSKTIDDAYAVFKIYIPVENIID